MKMDNGQNNPPTKPDGFGGRHYLVQTILEDVFARVVDGFKVQLLFMLFYIPFYHTQLELSLEVL